MTANLEIVDFKLYPIREPVSKRTYTVVRARTRDGITGFGEGPLASESDFAVARRFWTGRPASSYMAQAPPTTHNNTRNSALTPSSRR